MTDDRASRLGDETNRRLSAQGSPTQLAARIHRIRGVEAATDDEKLAAVKRVFDELERTLSDVIGTNGHRALLTRCVRKARLHHACLRPLGVEGPGVDLEELWACLWLQPPTVVEEIGVAMLGSSIELLSTLIGPYLTFRIVRDTWPEAISEAPSETKP